MAISDLMLDAHLAVISHLVVILSAGQSHLAAAASVPRTRVEMSRWCADANMEDLISTSEVCQRADNIGTGVECWAYFDAVLQLCLDQQAAASGQLADPEDAVGLLKRNRNRFLGKRGGSRNNFGLCAEVGKVVGKNVCETIDHVSSGT